MKVVAERGYGSRLVALSEPTESVFDMTLAVVVNTERGTVSHPANLHSLLSRGYWTPFEGDPEPVLARVRAAIEGGLLTPKQLKHVAGEGRGLLGREVTIDQLSVDFVNAYADWLGVTDDEAYMLLETEPLVEITDVPGADRAAGSNKA